MRLKLLRLQAGSFHSLTAICRHQTFNRTGPPLPKLHNELDRTARKIGNLFALKTASSCLTSRCVQVKNWQLIQGNVPASGKNVHYQSGEMFFPPWKRFGMAAMGNYRLNTERIKRLWNMSPRFHSIVAASKIIPKQSNQPVKRPPKAPRTKQPSRANQPLPSDMEVKNTICILHNIKGTSSASFTFRFGFRLKFSCN